MRTMLGDEQKRFLFDRLLNSQATWRVIVNEVPVQAYLALPYDRWEGYAAEREEILRFIRDNNIRNVVFLTTDVHANIFGPVRIDPFADEAPVAYEATVGPIATAPLEREVVDAIGAAGADLFGPFLTGLMRVECAELKSYSYGLVELHADSMTITAKDAAGAELCTKTLEAVR
jgi:phosphodiesterase/alkaline phosphatase D-like protein